MASLPFLLGPAPSQLLTLGMFIFGMDSLPYDQFRRAIGWRHTDTERHQARPASQFAGPGEDKISLSGFVIPELAGAYSAIDRIIEMADSGDDWPLLDGLGRVLGSFRIVSLEQRHHAVLAGGLPRAIEFTLELERVADPPAPEQPA